MWKEGIFVEIFIFDQNIDTKRLKSNLFLTYFQSFTQQNNMFNCKRFSFDYLNAVVDKIQTYSEVHADHNAKDRS